MASIKPRKRGESNLKELDNEMKRNFSMKMGQLKRLKKDIHEEDPDSGVIFISHIPHGFYEPQMKKFFSQFGNIKRLRLSRSKKSGRSKGYAYIEFEFSEVAKVVAETMHNYLMYQKLLKCFYVPKEKLHPDTFRGCFRHFKQPRKREIAAARNNRLLESGKDHIVKRQTRRVRNLAKKQEKLAELGVDFKIDSLESELTRLKKCQLPASPSGSKLEKPTQVAIATTKASPSAKKGRKVSKRTRKGRKRTTGDEPSAAEQESSKKQKSDPVEPSAKPKKAKKTVVPDKPKDEASIASPKRPAVRAKRQVKSSKVASKTRSRKEGGTTGKKSKRLSL